MEEREPLTQLTSCQNPVCAMEKKVLEGMLQSQRTECQGNCAMELKELKEEMAKLKRDMHDLVLKKKENEKLIVISPSYSVRSLNVDKQEAYRTLIDKTRIMEEQLTDILRSLEETDTPNRHVPSEEQLQLAKSPRMEGGSVSEDQNLVQMQETVPEGQNGTHEREHIAEAPSFVLDEFPAVGKGNMAPITDPGKEVGSALGVTEKENQERSQLSEVQGHEQIRVISNTVELAHDCEGKNSGGFGTEDKQPQVLNSEQHDLQVVQLESVEFPNPEKSPQHEQMEVISDTVELGHDCEGENSGGFGTEDNQPQVLNSEQHDLQVVQLKSVELPNPEKSPQHDLQVEQDSEMEKALVSVQLPQHDLHTENIVSNPLCVPMNVECSMDDQYLPLSNVKLSLDHRESTVAIEVAPVDLPKGPRIEPQEQQDLEMEKALVCVELPYPEKSPQRDLQVEQDSEMEKALVCVELPQHDLHIEDIVSNPLCVPMNMECYLNDRYLPLCNARLSLDHRESEVGIEVAPGDVPKGPQIEPQEQPNQLNGETEAHPYQLTEEAHQSDDPIQRQLIEVEKPKKQRLSEPELPELPCPGQPEEVRISKMVEELVLQQQQSSGYGLRKLVIGQPATTESPRKWPTTPKTRANTKEKPQKGSSTTRKASKAKSNSGTASNMSSLEEQQQPSEGQRRTKRKLDELWTPEKEQKQKKQRGRPKKTTLDKKPNKQKQPKGHDEPKTLVSDMTVKAVLPLDDDGDDDKQDEDGASQRSPTQNSNVSLMSQEEQQEAPKTQEELPDSEPAAEIVLPLASDDQGLGEQQCNSKPVKLNASVVVTEWLARQGLLEGRKRPGKA